MPRYMWTMSSIIAAGFAALLAFGNRYMRIDPLFEGDLNGDGRHEYIETVLFDQASPQLCVYDGSSVSIRPDGPYGRFSDAKRLLPPVPLPEGYEIAFSSRDVDSDGRMDAVVGQRPPEMSLLPGLTPVETEEIGYVHHNGERYLFTFLKE